MCTDHVRATDQPITPTIRRIALRRRAPLVTRRRLLFNAGIGTAGIAILAACGGSDDGSASGSATDSDTTLPAGSDASDDPVTADSEA
ncbi:MAG: hypothetical protein AAFP84_19460, partial [Actinomycetota bacterium]